MNRRRRLLFRFGSVHLKIRRSKDGKFRDEKYSGLSFRSPGNRPIRAHYGRGACTSDRPKIGGLFFAIVLTSNLWIIFFEGMDLFEARSEKFWSQLKRQYCLYLTLLISREEVYLSPKIALHDYRSTNQGRGLIANEDIQVVSLYTISK